MVKKEKKKENVLVSHGRAERGLNFRYMSDVD